MTPEPRSDIPVDAPTLSHPERLELRRAALRQSLAKILPANGRFIWELGCGHGHFLTAYAQAHPDSTCIGIDLMSDRIARATRKRDRARLAHLSFLQAEARLFLECLPAHARFTTLFILFPDPWPKLRHHKHRILQADFLSAAARHAAPDARVCFRTDYAPYFTAAQRTIAEHPDWHLAATPWPFEHATVFQTRAPAYQSFVAQPKPGNAPSIS
jgi:tRNA (guanine-N7-)-methyltransferase